MNFNPGSWTPEAWLQFLQDHWVVAVVAVLAIFVVSKVVKTVVKWVLIAAIVVGIVAYGGYSINDLQEVGSKVTSDLKDQAIKAMAGEADKARYRDNGDGTYTVETPNLQLSGVPNSGEVEVKFRGISLGKWNMEGAVRDLVVKARESAVK
ncbi:hypothetical protein E5161_17880 [Cohnella pontilimi]|uniref:Uncharacterized protein n=1 Tax=Cohnella pontilimi TaxID=2564100 RepID=A0A4U0F5E6_9BACL|nr:hypothetical protein [Cohnella pontilimi]TJY39813.1 hypothetical protein E5161_17880 [Cohnella pontilimi]